MSGKVAVGVVRDSRKFSGQSTSRGRLCDSTALGLPPLRCEKKRDRGTKRRRRFKRDAEGVEGVEIWGGGM